MGLLDKFKKSNPDDGYDVTEDNYYDDPDDNNGNAGADEETADTSVQKPEYQPASPVGMNLSGSSIELKVIKPESYKNSTMIADHLIAGRTVVLNLEATNKETARRLIDFLMGVAYSIDGDLKKVSNNTYVITPKNVAVSGDPFRDKSAEGEGEGDGDGSQIKDFYSDLQ